MQKRKVRIQFTSISCEGTVNLEIDFLITEEEGIEKLAAAIEQKFAADGLKVEKIVILAWSFFETPTFDPEAKHGGGKTLD